MSGPNDVEILEKRVSESRLYNFNFSPKLSDAESISSLVSLTNAATTTGLTALTVGTAVISGKQIQFRVSGGSDGGKYLFTGRVTTSLSNIVQAEGYLLVREP